MSKSATANPPLLSPELANTVFLVSGELPGTGSTSVAKQIASVLTKHGVEPFTLYMGDEVRKDLQVKNEAQMATALQDVPDPLVYDAPFYEGIPSEGPAVIEGKLATKIGSRFLDNSRPIVRVKLTAGELFSTKRVMAREGKGIEALFLAGEEGGDSGFLEHLEWIHERRRHDSKMAKGIDRVKPGPGQSIETHKVDTSDYLAHEVVAKILTGETFDSFVPDWEITCLRAVNGKLSQINALLEGDTHPIDRIHVSHQLESIRYHIDRLTVMIHPVGIQKVRDELQKSIIDCWFGLMMKRVPRFFTTEQADTGKRKLILDKESHNWTPEYYKVAEAWPILSALLKNKTVLDPFAGAGSFLNLLVARGIVKSATYSDLAYKGGKPINGSRELYVPKLNMEAAQLLFDDLPSWYKPDFKNVVQEPVTADARNLPFKDAEFDYVCTDPPYGKNCDAGGLGIMLGTINECLRVAKKGAIMMVPLKWMDDLRSHGGFDMETLTGDVSRGTSGFPVCYVRLTKKPGTH